MLKVREALPGDLPRVQQLYSETGYAGSVSRYDRLIIAEREAELLGVYRLARENGVLVLRGMRVAPAWQRAGIGTAMLRPLAGLSERCYCLPYVHLVAFYGQAGFARRGGSGSPEFLLHRLAEYRARGLQMCLMVREASAGGAPAA